MLVCVQRVTSEKDDRYRRVGVMTGEGERDGEEVIKLFIYS